MADSNLNYSSADEAFKNLFLISFNFYVNAEKNKQFYHDPANIERVKKLIELYYEIINPTYKHIDKLYDSFKRIYISTESKVENNDTPEERQGLGLVYDFIQEYDVFDREFDVLTNSLLIHQKLYKPLDDRVCVEYNLKRTNAYEMLEIARKEKDLQKYREAQELIRNIGNSARFGSKLRTGAVRLDKVDVDVPDAADAVKFINSFASTEKKAEFKEKLMNSNIFEYIDYCVKITTDLIKFQPFQDGNKRTFRSLLNLMFKYKNIPPVFIKKDEREAYKNALISAMKDGDYKEINQFYYFKICDSIYVLDFKNYEKTNPSTYTDDGTLKTKQNDSMSTIPRGMN